MKRIWRAFFYSLEGLRSTVQGEAAFRQELVLFVVLIPVLITLPVSLLFKALLFASNTLVLIIEILNSAIESIVDLVSPDHHVLAKQAKDMGSAAVLLSLLLAAILWACALYTLLG